MENYRTQRSCEPDPRNEANGLARTRRLFEREGRALPMPEKAKIVQKRKIRAGHRSSATKLLNRVKERLDDGTEDVEKHWIKQSIQTMREKIDSLKGLNNQIIELIGSLEDDGVEALIEKEIEESDNVRRELNHIVLRMEV